ncbi:hypothetical protein Acsp06_64650 [Actinomycetospora sp. NBRC 106375]|uniref:DUF5615 family PIN-like protein n=1 Tax=Actinomycetospora sp. NBRC 106375 TaxID=3032207 RepID=UPI0024A3F14A|nr:DUF5615 family PIN-like protein [Actinomycetospora sp. NBRC 106375]GLZ50280.1 hypothetical protein Acsp06_64650 [Actinomycetospora sp. NBRC 106375]
MTRRRPTEALLLDEMFSPTVAEVLRTDGFDVVPVAGHPLLAASADVEVARWAAREDRRVVTENVRDFAPLLTTTEPPLRVLFTSSRRFPRSRRNPGPFLEALRRWLHADVERAAAEWLQ